MKLFETTLENFAFFGLKWDETTKKYAFAKKSFYIPFMCTVCVFSSILFIMFEAETFYEITFTAIMGIIIYIALNIKVNTFNNFIENCRDLVNESKRN